MINVIFDATILLNWRETGSVRSGSFFVAQNIYERFRKNPEVNLFLYFDLKNINSFLMNAIVFPEPVVNDFDNLFWKIFWEINKRMRFYHKKWYNHVLLRKPFALGILLSQNFLQRNKMVKQPIVSQCQVFFSPLFSIPQVIKKQKNLLFFTMLYDTIPFWMPEDCGEEWTNELKKIVNNVDERDYFICDSFNSFLDFNKINPKISSDNTSVALLAADDKFCEGKEDSLPDDLMQKYNLPKGKRYAFCLSSVSPRKNFKKMAESFLIFVKKNNVQDMIFIVCGSGSEEFIHKIQNEHPYEKELIDSTFFPTGYVRDDEKVLLYQHAEWFVYTSQYEGFGLPPLEAMQCGCPVITSNNSSLPEVVGDAGIMIDWDSEEQHIEAYEKYYFDKELKKENSRRGLDRAKLFSWEKCADCITESMMEKITLRNQKNDL